MAEPTGALCGNLLSGNVLHGDADLRAYFEVFHWPGRPFG
jgi:hypothetical protein